MIRTVCYNGKEVLFSDGIAVVARERITEDDFWLLNGTINDWLQGQLDADELAIRLSRIALTQ